MFNSFNLVLLAAIPTTPNWSVKVALVMILSNLLAIAIGRYAIQVKGVGPTLPVSLPGLFSGFGLPELLATTSFGHVLGTGFILGMGQAGLL